MTAPRLVDVLDRLLELHRDTTGDRTCDECGYTNPCRTEQLIREALGGLR